MGCSTDIPDFSQPLPDRAPWSTPGQGPRHTVEDTFELERSDAKKSGARRADPNDPRLCGLSQAQRGYVLNLIEECCKAAIAEAQKAEMGPYAENVVKVDLVSVFLDGGQPTVLLVPAGGKMLKARISPALLGSLIAGLGATAGALIGSR